MTSIKIPCLACLKQKEKQLPGLLNQNLWGGAPEAVHLNRFPDDSDSIKVCGALAYTRFSLHPRLPALVIMTFFLTSSISNPCSSHPKYSLSGQQIPTAHLRMRHLLMSLGLDDPWRDGLFSQVGSRLDRDKGDDSFNEYRYPSLCRCHGRQRIVSHGLALQELFVCTQKAHPIFHLKASKMLFV